MTWSSASAHRLLCDLKFCISASTHGIYFGLKFRLRTRNILRLKVSQFRFRIQNSVWLGSSEMAQFRFCTRKILWLGSYAIPLPFNKFSTTWSFTVPLPYKSFDILSPAVPPPHKEYPATWSSASAQGIYYVSKFSSSAFAHRTICDLKFLSFAQYTVTWISAVPLPQNKRRHLKFRTSASPREHNFSLENPLSFNHPPIS